jgi:hypothetical protein
MNMIVNSANWALPFIKDEKKLALELNSTETKTLPLTFGEK